MSGAKLILRPLKRHDGSATDQQHAESVEAKINNDRIPTVRLKGEGSKCAAGVKTTIRLLKEGTK